jgi:chorismate synthase
MNTFGDLFRVTTFGESHGPAMGAVIDGCPSGIALPLERVQASLDRRRPGQSKLTTARAEPDRVELLSGVYEGRTLGTPIAALVRNVDARPADYDKLRTEDRPGHADRVWRERFGHRDPRGGGRTSGRETLSRVIGGAVAETMLAEHVPELRLVAWTQLVGPVEAPELGAVPSRAQIDAHPTRCPHLETATKMQELISRARESGDSWGGAIELVATGVPPGLGEPVFGKLKAMLAGGFAGIGAVAGVTWTDVEALKQPGREFHARADVYGGIQGGLSNGEPLRMRVWFKPPATLGEHALGGRHDPCILPRAVPVIEAMAALVLADAWLLQRARPHRS